ncbi:type II CRISPR RNA-guided endonuclease Cas9 [Micrococcoides hystricis]|uniref:Type II CRISPR RNA-guided endonuclease Cas9 n=1 Tax=Micrococcoides hystricis TaxID=1572761 RepID=A0ABV6PAN5_9MICC
MRYLVGIDVGDRSVGIAAFEVDDAGIPLRRLSFQSVRHDGGLQPGSEKSPVSRRATSGIARRMRRLIKRKRARLRKLDAKLRELGYPVPTVEVPQTYEAWHARSRLVTEQIHDERELRELVSMGLRHIARHRGWRNPYWSWSRLKQAPVPSASLQKIRVDAAATLGRDFSNGEITLGQIGWLGANRDTLIRPRENERSKKTGRTPLFNHRLMQEDHLQEIRMIWKTQGLPHRHLEALTKAIFHQEKPGVPAENVGRDSLPGRAHLRRALRSSEVFERFRLVAVLRNLRVKNAPNEEYIPLNEEQFQTLLDLLTRWHLERGQKGERPTWGDLAEVLHVELPWIRKGNFDGDPTTGVPVLDSALKLNGVFEKNKKNASEAYEWWLEASSEDRNDLIRFLDEVAEDDEDPVSEEISELVATWPEELIGALEGANLTAGRASYSEQSLQELTDLMLNERLNLHEARKKAFGVDDSWKPKPPSIQERTKQPAVDRVLAIVRQTIMGLVSKYGIPDDVVVEHARSGLMGPQARAEYQREIAANRNRRQKIANNLKTEKQVDNPTGVDIRREIVFQRQRGECLYCGSGLEGGFELDHIVSRADGGANTRENLVAACRKCNAAKHRRPFAVFAKTSSLPGVSVAEAVARVRSWQQPQLDSQRDLRRLQQRVIQRLRQTEDDEPIDDRSLASTQYSALEVRSRLQGFLDSEANKRGQSSPQVQVYSGRIVSAARKASGIDGQLRLRGAEIKSRSDYRHHAIDAAVIAMMNPSIARTLAKRESLREAHRFTNNYPDWQGFTGSTAGMRNQFESWKLRMQALAELLQESVREDRIVVKNVLRLRPERGSVHADTIAALELKTAGEEWTSKHVARIASPDVYLRFKSALGKTKTFIPANASELDDCGLKPESEIQLFRRPGPQIIVRGGSATIGDNIHHARIFSWKDRNGAMLFGVQRIFTAELPLIFGPNYKQRDLFSGEIPEWSFGHRDMQATVVKTLENGLAKQIGWFVVGDELEVDPADFEDGKDQFSRFLREMPETRWEVRGLPESRLVLVRPHYLSTEQIPSSLSKDVQQVWEKGCRVSASSLLSAPGTTFIRRASLGMPIWASNGRQQIFSFNVTQRAEHLLESDEANEVASS